MKDRVVGGWYVSTIRSYHSGTPTEVYGDCQNTAGAVLFGGCNTTGAGARVNVVPGVRQTNASNFSPTTEPFWNPAAFTQAAAFTFGNEGRSLPLARSFGGKNEDFTIGKKTRLIDEKATIDFQASFFNMFNRHIYSTPIAVFPSRSVLLHNPCTVPSATPYLANRFAPGLSKFPSNRRSMETRDPSQQSAHRRQFFFAGHFENTARGLPHSVHRPRQSGRNRR